MQATIARPPEAAPRREVGPPLVLPALASALLFGAGLVLAPSPPLPGSPAEEVLAYYREHGHGAQLLGFFQFGASVPLAIYAAAASARLRRLGMDVPGASIGLAGGVLASAALSGSGLLQWAAARVAPLGDSALVSALRDLSFAAGGVGHVAPLGLLLAGIAVPSLFGKLLPRWLAWSGVALAVVAELSWLSLLAPAATLALPVARFGGLAWLIAAGALLPRSRPRGATGRR